MEKGPQTHEMSQENAIKCPSYLHSYDNNALFDKMIALPD